VALTRRAFLQVGCLGLTACSLPKFTLQESDGEVDFVLVAEPASVEIVPGKQTAAMTFNGDYPAPVIRAKQGKRIRIRFINRLNEPTTIHWHGIRIENAMDGVPFLTQPPIPAGESFIYDFTCPDAGTFWYHPHVNSLVQLGKGLTGAFIVEEAEPVAFDHEAVVQLRDWRLDKEGDFLPLSIPRQAARAGTLGTVKTVNGLIKPTLEIPAGGTIRARFLNLDNSRVYHLSFKDYPAQVLALDGNAIAKPYALDSRDTGAGMRLDVGFIAPDEVGQEVIVYDKKGRGFFEIFRFRTVASNLPKRTEVPSLPVNPIPAPDVANAEQMKLVFEWAGALSPVKADGSVDHSFWTINRRSWEGMSKESIPGPLMALKLGRSYVIELHNATPHHHPIHMHGITFTVLSSNKREITPYHTDTVLLARNEKVKIGFVADNPGRWMFHCHVIEHLKTGLMGYISIV